MDKPKSTLKKPFFSVIIPTLNEEKFIPCLLTSLQQQTFSNFEIIVVDANSQDKTIKVCLENKHEFNNFKITSSSKKNVSYQRNLGAKIAEAPFLLFLDADVLLAKDYFKNIHLFIKRHHPDVFFSRIIFPEKKFSYKLINWWWNTFFPIFLKFNRNMGIGGMLGMSKPVFDKIKGYNQKLALAEEHDVVKRARKMGFTISYIKSAHAVLSSRRVDKEGLMKFLLKYLYFIIYEHIKGPIYKAPLHYPMGGEHYD